MASWMNISNCTSDQQPMHLKPYPSIASSMAATPTSDTRKENTMKRRLLNRLYAALEWLLLLLDGHMPTQVRIKAVRPVPFVVPVQQVPRPGISKARAAMYHQCIPPGDIIPWEGGSWYCPKCRKVRTY